MVKSEIVSVYSLNAPLFLRLGSTRTVGFMQTKAIQRDILQKCRTGPTANEKGESRTTGAKEQR